MAYKLLNKTAEGFNLKDVEDENLFNFVENIKQGEYEIIPNWDYMEKLFDIFPDNEDWEIEELSSGMFLILPTNTTTFQRNKFKEILEEDKQYK